MPKLCFGCMAQKESSPHCEHCGFDERKDNLSHQLPMGTILQNQYLVGKVLGQGGFGITYIGWDQHLSVPVAIKEYFPGGVVHRNTRWGTYVTCDNGASPEIFEKHKERFLKEARTLAKLSDIPEIVQIRNFFSQNGTAYIVMEYVRGITLKDHLKSLGRPMTEAEALAIMEPVMLALQKVHEQNLIHRDISPDNIMLPRNGGVKLIDFGTVRYMDDSGRSKSTEAVLKPGFAPMEQYNTRGDLGTWTDVYAICATFHYLLTGKVPMDVHERMVSGDQLSDLRNRQGISRNLIRVLEKGMKILPGDRIQTIEQLYAMLYGKNRKKAEPQKKPKQEPAPVEESIKKLKLDFKQLSIKHKTWIFLLIAAILVEIVVLCMVLRPKKKEAASVPAAQTAVTVPESSGQESGVPGVSIPENTEPEESLSRKAIAYAEAEALEEAGEYAKAAIAFGKLENYTDARERSFFLWNRIYQKDSIYHIAGTFYGLKTDGSIITAGEDLFGIAGNPDWENTVQLAGGDPNDWNLKDICLLGLRSDGTVVTAGHNEAGQCDVSEWTDVVNLWHSGRWISQTSRDEAGYTHRTYQDYLGSTVGLLSDGTVVTAGTISEFVDVSGWTDIVDLNYGTNTDYRTGATDGGFMVGLRADGTLLITGNFIPELVKEAENWTDIVDIQVSGTVVTGLRSDGTVMVVFDKTAEHYRNFPQWYEAMRDWKNVKMLISSTSALTNDGKILTMVPAEAAHIHNDARISMRASWENIVSVASGASIALKADGTVVVAVFDDHPASRVQGWTDVAAVCGVTGNYNGHVIGIRKDGTVLAVGDTRHIGEVATWTDIKLPN